MYELIKKFSLPMYTLMKIMYLTSDLVSCGLSRINNAVYMVAAIVRESPSLNIFFQFRLLNIHIYIYIDLFHDKWSELR